MKLYDNLGYVTGISGMQEISKAQLYIDKKNYRLFIFNDAQSECVSEYQIHCFSDFRYIGYDTKPINNQIVNRDYFKLIISETNIIDFYIENVFEHKSDRFIENDIRLRLNLIYPFIHLIEDDATISWVNDFCTHNDLFPLFDESGEVSVNNMKENAILMNI